MSTPSPPSPVRLSRSYNAASHFIDRHIQEGRGQKVAFIDDDGEHTYAFLADQVNRCAHALATLGVCQEQRVMLALLDSVAFPIAFFGAIKLGAIPVPVNTLFTTEDIACLLRDSRACAFILSRALHDKLEPATHDQPALRHIRVAGNADDSWNAALSAASDAPFGVADTTPDDAAFWLYSSGSTGQPKGTVHLMGSLAQTAHLYGEAVLGIHEEDVVLSAAKLFFAYGLGNAMTFPLHVGATAVLMAERPTPASIARRFDAHAPTIFFGVPTLYGAMLSSSEDVNVSHLRRCVSAGEALPADLLSRWQARYQLPILDGIGSTELLHIFLSNRPDDVKPGASGRAVPGYTLRIVHADGAPVENEAIGELEVNGPSAALAYWNQRGKSLTTFCGPWTRTGDKYRRDDDGYYFYAGRADDMLKVSGIWVSPFEVESALMHHPAVREAAVVGKRDADALIKPKAFVVLEPGIRKPGQATSEELAVELMRHVKSLLAPYKYPRWVDFVEELPKTATGKIRRFLLREREARDTPTE